VVSVGKCEFILFNLSEIQSGNLKMLPIVQIILLHTFLFLIPGGENRRIQQFSLYSVTEQKENYTQNVPDLDLVSPIVRDNKLQSVCSQMGV